MSLMGEARRVAAIFELSDSDVDKCFEALTREMDEGLQMRMTVSNTYLGRVADGTEKGLSLAVHLGGSTVRVSSVEFHGDRTYTLIQSNNSIPKDIIVDQPATDLFAFIAERVRDFVHMHYSDYIVCQASNCKARSHEFKKLLRLGFTCTHPAKQTAWNSSIPLHWTQTFTLSDQVGRDLCRLLQREIKSQHIPVTVAAFVNKIVSTIMSRAYSVGKATKIGAMVGTTTNGAYLKALPQLAKPSTGRETISSDALLRCVEWGAPDNTLRVLPNTRYDVQLDMNSINPHHQLFEKRVCSLFLGELLRLTILSMVLDPEVCLFKGYALTATSTLRTKWAVDSSTLSIAEHDTSLTMDILRPKLGYTFSIPLANITPADACAVRIVARAITLRAARLAGLAFAVIIVQSGQLSTVDDSDAPGSHDVDIAVDGSMIAKFPRFLDDMRETLGVCKGIGPALMEKITVGPGNDGPTVGAALVALMAGPDPERWNVTEGEGSARRSVSISFEA